MLGPEVMWNREVLFKELKSWRDDAKQRQAGEK